MRRTDAIARANISIHTPLAGSDLRGVRLEARLGISIHTPLAGSDAVKGVTALWDTVFQSTLPLRGATGLYETEGDIILKFQSTLPLRGATAGFGADGAVLRISIHTPLAGSDNPKDRQTRPRNDFNPHSPCGERPYGVARFDARVISIHTPLAGSDPMPLDAASSWTFQSTLPLRGATAAGMVTVVFFEFQSTLPLRGATAEMRHF